MHFSNKWWFWVIIGVALVTFLVLIRVILLPFVVGGLLAYSLDPAADKLEKMGMRRFWAAALIICSFFLLFFLGVILLAPVIYNQLAGIIVTIPHFVQTLQDHYGYRFHALMNQFVPGNSQNAENVVQGFSGEIVTFISGLFAGLLRSGATIINIFSLLVITPVVAFYLLRDWDRIIVQIDELMPLEHRDVIREQSRKIDSVISGFIHGQLNVCLGLGIFYAVGLSLAGLQFAVLVGMVTGLLALIPYAGIVLGTLIGVGIAFFQFDDMSRVAIVLGVFLLGQFLEGNFITPKIMGEKVGLHPVWIIFGLLAGGALFGFVGILIAVPVTAVIGVLVRFALERYQASSLYNTTAGKIIVPEKSRD